MAEHGFEFVDVENGVPVKMWTKGVSVEPRAREQTSIVRAKPFKFNSPCNSYLTVPLFTKVCACVSTMLGPNVGTPEGTLTVIPFDSVMALPLI